MKGIRLVCILLVFAFLVSCGMRSKDKIKPTDVKVTDTKVTDAADKPFNENDSKSSVPIQKYVYSPRPENTSTVNKNDYQKYGWGLSLNKVHKTPGFWSVGKALMDKYEGIYIGDTSKKVVYITFDEGYENGYTPIILDTLRDNGVKSIFFITGTYLNTNQQLVKRMIEEGHEVGNHTMNHPSLPIIDNEKINNEIADLGEKFYKMFGKKLSYFRPPNGEYNERTLAKTRDMGYKTVMWSFAYKDYEVDKQNGPDYAYDMVMSHVHNGAVLLLHAVSSDNANALDRIIKELKKNGYIISPFNL